MWDNRSHSAGTVVAGGGGGTDKGELEAWEAVIRESFAKQAVVSTFGNCGGELEAIYDTTGFKD